MSTFGELLRKYRQLSLDRDRGRILTQRQLGELLGEELGAASFTGATVSEWERDQSQIHHYQREVLVALIRVLHKYGGITSPSDANLLLQAGNYRPLDADESYNVNPKWNLSDAGGSYSQLGTLSELMVSYFTTEDLKNICFDLDIDYDALRGQTKTAKIRALLIDVYTHGRLYLLLSYLQRARPTVDWQFRSTSQENLSASTDRAQLREILQVAFSESELRALSFDLRIDYESLPGSSKAEKIRELVGYMERRNYSSQLVAYIQRERPRLWREVYNATLPELVSISSAEELEEYIRQTGKETIPLHEAKMLLVGQGGVGKTSLLNRLLKLPFNRQEDKTKGIAIRRWSLPLEDETKIRLNVWDFGGQEIYHATHQFFFTQRSLYVLVVDARQGEQESRLDYWLKLIQSFADAAPVIVVVNKVDQHFIELDERGLLKKYPDIRAFVYTSCVTGQGIEKLQNDITKAIEGLTHIHDELRTSWYKVKVRLESLKKDFISYDQYLETCEEEGIESESDQRLLIRLLHDLGSVLNFQQDRRLEDTNVLNPEWVTHAVYQILTSDLLSENRGILRLEQLSQILDPHLYPSRKHPYIIDIMRKFELCFPFAEQTEQYLVPELLTRQEPEFEWNLRNSLAFQYHYDVLPGSIISRFIVRLHKLIHEQTYWRNGVVVSMDESKALVKADPEDKRIFIWVTDISETRNTLMRRSLLSIIRAQFREIHESLAKLQVAEVIPLPEHPNQTITYRELRILEQNHIDRHFYPQIETFIDVQQLLNGIESPQERNLPALRDKIVNHFSLEDIIDIAFRLSIDSQKFGTKAIDELTRELLLYLDRRGRIPELISLCQRLNPAIEW
jgi:small GTP-binding protein